MIIFMMFLIVLFTIKINIIKLIFNISNIKNFEFNMNNDSKNKNFDSFWNWLRDIDKDLNKKEEKKEKTEDDILIEAMNSLFIDEDDYNLTKTSELDLIGLTKLIFTKFYENRKKKIIQKKLKLYLIVCYILCVKYYTDSWLNSPSQFICSILKDEFSLKIINKTEKEILQGINYIFPHSYTLNSE